MINLIDVKTKDIPVNDKTFTIHSLSLIEIILIMKVLPMTFVGKIFGLAAQKDFPAAFEEMAKLMQRDAESFIKAMNKATNIPYDTLGKFRPNDFAYLLDEVIEVNKESFDIRFFLDKYKAETEKMLSGEMQSKS